MPYTVSRAYLLWWAGAGLEPFDSSALRTRSWPRADESNGLSERSESNGPPTVAHRDPHEFWTHEAREKFDVAARSSEGLSPPNPPLTIRGD